MEAFKISVKFFVANDVFQPAEFVPVFHRWIQTQSVENHLLIDVADYAHVPDGPGTVLVSSEANFYMDRSAGPLGLLYSRKTPLPGTFRDRLHGMIAEAIKAAAKLELEPEMAGRLKFRTNEILIRIHDRLLAPNTPETFAAVKPEFEAVAKELYPAAAVAIEHDPSPEKLLEFRLKANESPSLATLLGRLARLETAIHS